MILALLSLDIIGTKITHFKKKFKKTPDLFIMLIVFESVGRINNSLLRHFKMRHSINLIFKKAEAPYLSK